jgi:prevent-host-death family protein
MEFVEEKATPEKTDQTGAGHDKVVSVVKAKKHFSDLMSHVAYGGARLVVERHGKPMMAWVSYENLRRLEALDRNSEGYARRIAALALADASRARIAAEHGGVPRPDSTEILYRLREGRLNE